MQSSGLECELRNQAAEFRILTLLLTGCVTFGKLPNLSVLPFPHLKKKKWFMIIVTFDYLRTWKIAVREEMW